MNEKLSTDVPLVVPMTPCTSSMIAAHGYDQETGTLAVKFSNGTVYHYGGVPQDLATEFANCKSVGVVFGSKVRGKFVGAKQ